MSTNVPHILKKGKVLKLKNLDLTVPRREYYFSMDKGSVQGIINMLNNLSQITARNFLKLSKLNHFLGIQKDSTEILSTQKFDFGEFFDKISTLFERGEMMQDAQNHEENRPVHPYDELDELRNDIHTLTTLVVKQDERIDLLKHLIDQNMNKIIVLNEAIVTKTVLTETFANFDERLHTIQKAIYDIMG